MMTLKELALVTPAQVREAAEALKESAHRIDCDGTPSQAGMDPDEIRSIAAMLERLSGEMNAQRELRRELRKERARANSAERDLRAAWKYGVPTP